LLTITGASPLPGQRVGRLSANTDPTILTKLSGARGTSAYCATLRLGCASPRPRFARRSDRTASSARHCRPDALRSEALPLSSLTSWSARARPEHYGVRGFVQFARVPGRRLVGRHSASPRARRSGRADPSRIVTVHSSKAVSGRASFLSIGLRCPPRPRPFWGTAGATNSLHWRSPVTPPTLESAHAGERTRKSATRTFCCSRCLTRANGSARHSDFSWCDEKSWRNTRLSGSTAIP